MSYGRQWPKKYTGFCARLSSRLRRHRSLPFAVHDLAPDALVREISHSSAYWEDHIEAKDVDSVLDRREHALPSQRGTQYLVDGLAAKVFLENQLDDDAGSF
jgi:hypothetical protein